MKLIEAYTYLRARAELQSEQKTSYNRLRWTKRDLDAVKALLDAIDAAHNKAAHDLASGIATERSLTIDEAREILARQLP